MGCAPGFAKAIFLIWALRKNLGLRTFIRTRCCNEQRVCLILEKSYAVPMLEKDEKR